MTDGKSTQTAWYSFQFTLAAHPSRHRVNVWRRLKKAGALNLSGGTWLLPKSAPALKLLTGLRDEVRNHDGQAWVAEAGYFHAGDEQRIIAQFNADRYEEYLEFIGKCDALLEELKEETAIQKFTFAELEENDELFQRLEGWLKLIESRDYFKEELGEKARERWQTCQTALDRFAESVYQKNNSGEMP